MLAQLSDLIPQHAESTMIVAMGLSLAAGALCFLIFLMLLVRKTKQKLANTGTGIEERA